MPKTLFISGLIILSLVTLLSVASSYQRSVFNAKDEQINSSALSSKQPFAWKMVLSTTSQFQPLITQDPSQTLQNKVTVISDASVVGIVLDTPSSALLVIQGNDDVMPLKVGEGWLENWVIESLQADAVNWLNTENQEHYIQPLFDLSTSENATDTKVNKKRNGKRK